MEVYWRWLVWGIIAKFVPAEKILCIIALQAKILYITMERLVAPAARVHYEYSAAGTTVLSVPVLVRYYIKTSTSTAWGTGAAIEAHLS